ncbi:MAG TPA: DUF998 domain-containing protein [Candidatus Dormibacteraeota bacterium]|nr:DUF998 domain-containing protein [Candidatus Dormibacteraeota bacterium]
MAGGAAVGPLFVGLSLAQVPFRPGFVLGRMPISMLTLGDLGWIQILNFVVTGLLALACAVGMRRTLRHRSGRTWGPVKGAAIKELMDSDWIAICLIEMALPVARPQTDRLCAIR